MLLLCFVSVANAALFKITNRTGGPAALLAMQLLEDDINKSLPDADHTNYLKGMANSSIMANKGLGIDYAADMSIIEAGLGIGIGADLGGSNGSFSKLVTGDVDANQIRGFGIQSTFMFGLHLGIIPFKGIGPFEFKRANLYFNLMSSDMPEQDGIEGKISSSGFHLQYKIIDEIGLPLGMLKWGGLSFSTGLEYSKMKISYSMAYDEGMEYSGTTASFDGNVKVGADIATYSIPLELTTSFQFLYIVAPFCGVAADFNFGEAKSIAELTGDITVTGIETGTGTASLSLGDKVSPETFSYRYLAGIQLNIPFARIYAQIQKSISPAGIWGIGLGARIAW